MLNRATVGHGACFAAVQCWVIPVALPAPGQVDAGLPFSWQAACRGAHSPAHAPRQHTAGGKLPGRMGTDAGNAMQCPSG